MLCNRKIYDMYLFSLLLFRLKTTHSMMSFSRHIILWLHQCSAVYVDNLSMVTGSLSMNPPTYLTMQDNQVKENLKLPKMYIMMWVLLEKCYINYI